MIIIVLGIIMSKFPERMFPKECSSSNSYTGQKIDWLFSTI